MAETTTAATPAAPGASGKATGKAASGAKAPQAAKPTESQEGPPETPEETTEDEGAEEGGAREGSAVVGSGESEEAGEGEGEEEGSTEEAEPSAEDAQEVTLDGGERVSLGELKGAYQYLPQAIEAYKKGKAMHEAAKELVGRVTHAETLEGARAALVELFAPRFRGDREKAFRFLIHEICSPLINEHLEYEEMPEERRELLRMKQRAETAEEEARRVKEEREAEAARVQQEEGAKVWGLRITQALKTAGMEADKETVDDVADVILEAHEVGRTISIPQAVAVLKRERAKRAARDWTKVSPEEIPDEAWNRLQAAKVAQHRGAKPAARVVKPTASAAPPPPSSIDESLTPLV